ncbi:hypothetical protein CPHO_10830 [Corynebacterium phocae]|uniref:DUF2029 domain-containing protein n=1 Tax=Corynebacterium phocae TaxID=161895 RepID=A0A1L7D5B3_9CORY|nr:glycosyltransferase 87 family protein [Corynebacterium phocae]APT93305.1 hypothetical protein CPHO_10830 [Corynebacterium phocae]KAA8721634.1 DUF2029 domain-containing protein [Corynebacterium phocae]
MKLHGRVTLATLFTLLTALVFYRYSIFDSDHALQWREPLDLKIYALAGKDVAEGGLLYDAPYIGDLPFTYPPFAGVVFQGLAALSADTVFVLWQFGTAFALLAVVLLVLRNRNVQLDWLTVYIAACATFCSLALAPVAGTLFFGQINIFLMLLVALDFLPKKYRLPGVGIGLAAGMKLTPAYLGLVLLFQRRWGAACGSMLTFMATAGIGFLLIPDARDFWSDAVFRSSRVGVHENGGAMAVRSVFHRAFDIDGGPVWILAIVVIVLINCAAVSVACARHNGAAAMAFTGLGACLVSPFSWFHHFVWLVPLLVLILVGTNRYLGPKIGSQAAGLISFLAMALAALPWLSQPVARSVSFYQLNNLDELAPWGTLLFSGAVVIYMAVYAASGFFTLRGRSRF